MTGGDWHYDFFSGCLTNTPIATPKSGRSCCVGVLILFLLECSDAFFYRSHFRDSIAGTERSRRAAAAMLLSWTRVVHVGSFKLVLGVFLINGDGLYHNYLSELSTKNYQKCYHSFVNVDTVVVALLLKHIHIHF